MSVEGETALLVDAPEARALALEMEPLSAGERIELLAGRCGGQLVASTSFGLQAVVMLDLLHRHAPEVPVVFIDTGYLFAATYRYAEELIELLGLDVRVYSPVMTAARCEALNGRLWEAGPAGIERYGLLHKVEPMNRALAELGARVWISGVRRSQSSTRSGRAFAERQKRTVKAYPILDWGDDRVARYLDERDLPRHPLAGAGYVTMGDQHSTRPAGTGEDAESTRFDGSRFECGLHLDSGVRDYQI